MAKQELFNSNFSLPIYALLLFAIFGITWLAIKKVDAAIIFLSLFLMSISILVLSFLFINEKDPRNIKNFFKEPFGTDLDLSVGLFVIGISIPLIIEFIGGVTGTGFSITSIQVPFAVGTTLASITQTFSAAQATASPFTNLYITTFVAGTIEELVFGFILILAGFLLSKFLIQMIDSNGTTFLTRYSKTFNTIFGILFSVALFTYAHTLNSSYTSSEAFLFAAFFRLILNISIYFGPALLSFTVGLHLMNNVIYYANTFGRDALVGGLNSFPGLLIMIFFGLIFFYFLRRIGIIFSKMGNRISNMF